MAKKKEQTLAAMSAVQAAASDNPMAGSAPVGKPKASSDDILTRVNLLLDEMSAEFEFTLGDVIGALTVATLQVDEQLRINTRRNIQARDVEIAKAQAEQQQPPAQDNRLRLG